MLGKLTRCVRRSYAVGTLSRPGLRVLTFGFGVLSRLDEAGDGGFEGVV